MGSAEDIANWLYSFYLWQIPSVQLILDAWHQWIYVYVLIKAPSDDDASECRIGCSVSTEGLGFVLMQKKHTAWPPKMKCYCGSICKVGNAVRLSHFIITFFVFYVMLTNEHSGKLVDRCTRMYSTLYNDSKPFCCKVILPLCALCEYSEGDWSLTVQVDWPIDSRVSLYLWFRLTLIACSISSSIDLHDAWIKKNAYFICLVILLSVSLFLYLVASLIDPGFLPKLDPPLPSLKPSSESQSTPSFPDKVGIHWTIHSTAAVITGQLCCPQFLFLGRKLLSTQPLKLFPLQSPHAATDLSHRGRRKVCTCGWDCMNQKL